ncbi:MAG: tetratricopeptide repeat protein [Synoicihabitans sp.]
MLWFGLIALFAPFVVAQNAITPSPSDGPSFSTAQTLYLQGELDLALEMARTGTALESDNEAWWRLEGEILMLKGEYEDLYARMTSATAAIPNGLWVMMLRKDSARYHAELWPQSYYEESEIVRAINYAAYQRTRPVAGDADFLAAVSQATLRAGIEPKLVLENFLKPAQEAEPASRDAFLIGGQLALDKQDPALAARTFQRGLELFPDDPGLLAGYAASFRDSNPPQMMELAEQALTQNPTQITARLLMIDYFINAEDFATARLEIDRVLDVNPRHAEAHAYLAAIASLENDAAAAERHLETALRDWPRNPRVHHLVGLKLSQRYRFEEGAAAQRLAVAADPNFIPAKVQLARDLLRLGEEEEGWYFAELAHDGDGYNIDAFNLTTLRDRIDDFTTVESDHFRIRMSPEEAAIYGDRALALLEEARADLTSRYGIELEKVTTVEIYPNSQDFAVRTFGMPGVGGFLGVCFGSVFTVNSPASQQANWEAVLWHEFAHVITLSMSRNRMPRWLSEGISVYEELRRNPAWGQRMSADYYRRIVAGELNPVSRMSAAFMEAEDPAATIFAYYQSYLVVEYLIGTYGFEPLKNLLRDLASGREINDALAEYFAPMDELDEAFSDYATALAHQFAPDLDLSRNEETPGMVVQLIPDLNIPGLSDKNLDESLARIGNLMDAENWKDARELLESLIEEGTYFPGPENLHLLHARVCRELGDHVAEKESLLTIISHQADQLYAVVRLLDLAQDEENWAEVAQWSDAWLAIDPLGATPWRARLEAHLALNEPAVARAAGETLLRLDPPDRAAIHFELATLLEPTDAVAARRHVLQALEEAPRFREAYELLDRIPAPAVLPTP